MNDWIDALAAQRRVGRAAVLVSVVAAKGSVPRAAGTRMIVTADAIARHDRRRPPRIQGDRRSRATCSTARGRAPLHRFPLGASLGQCCGGVAQLLFEPVRGRARPGSMRCRALRARTATDCALVIAGARRRAGERLVVTRDDARSARWARRTYDASAAALARRCLAGDGAPRLADARRRRRAIDVLRRRRAAARFSRSCCSARATSAARWCVRWPASPAGSPGSTRATTRFRAAIPGNVECVATDAPEAEVAAAPRRRVLSRDDAQPSRRTRRSPSAFSRRDDFAYFGLIGSRVEAPPVRAAAGGARHAARALRGDDLPDRHRRHRGQGARGDRHRGRRASCCRCAAGRGGRRIARTIATRLSAAPPQRTDDAESRARAAGRR